MRRRSFQKLALGSLAALPGCQEPPVPVPDSLAAQSRLLEEARLSCEQITRHYLDRIAQIDRASPALNAVIETNAEALELARALDHDLRMGKPLRGPLHGIPILLKDNIETADRMLTTAGSLALLDSRPRADAALVRRLRAAGAVLLGKTNLSEWANMRSPRSTSGWSARGGLTKNPHVLDHNPSGSSSGSAAAVSAGLCAAAIGTETDGSIVSPSNACGVVGLKPTLGLINSAGIIPITHWQDTAGPMARSVEDCALLLAAISEKPLDYRAALAGTDLQGLRLGFLRHLNGAHADVQRLTTAALDLLRDLGAEIIEVELPHTREIGRLRFRAMLGEYREDLNAYLGTTSGKVRSIADLIAFNQENAEREMPHFGQEFLEMAAALDSAEALVETRAARETARRLAREEGIDLVLKQHRLDALVVSTSDPADKTDLATGHRGGRGCSTVPATAGYPHLSVPMGFAGPLPCNLSFFSTAWTEPLLLRLGHAYEQAARHDMRPRFLPAI
ncbi:MAG: amidase [Verrucomicrobiaceae bacterium]|nr:amidase [Verrucomicrobiaceae bacterium]